jgi:hypothetical protein
MSYEIRDSQGNIQGSNIHDNKVNTNTFVGAQSTTQTAAMFKWANAAPKFSVPQDRWGDLSYDPIVEKIGRDIANKFGVEPQVAENFAKIVVSVMPSTQWERQTGSHFVDELENNLQACLDSIKRA